MAALSACQCSICGSKFSHSSSLSRHLKNSHNKENSKIGTNFCTETNCDKKFINMDGLIEHLVETHNQSINVITKSFPSLHNFMQWKEELEIKSSSSFVLHSSPKQRVDCTCYYYYSNRSGQYNSKGKGKRNLKIQGTSKIGSHCTAYIRVQKFLSGEVSAEICNHHTHPIELGHLKRFDSVQQMIAAKLSDGVIISAILDSVRDNIEKIDRTALLCRQDIHNVMHQYNIAVLRDQDNDGSNPILLFKQQSYEQPSDIDDMAKNEFLIRIQTLFQRDMLLQFGPKAICMDSTNSTNAYDFFLITILVLDDLGEGVPIAWIISNREDAATIRQVLIKMKENVVTFIQVFL
ncbi:PREDICTED: uncharacterized protein LOC100634557 [Amphimedon queenslandica]|uniref:C2H2-type domain-containing protein n=1 Tax=Amphimedon queenslandica TaxID=400682 RepID=A0AAN0IKT2_AMPQE|nr:PREDICTED: uncharacterized protein LOC100634557 [Amphimedon queenslandica]|eukprot:XP_011402771.1 PREDICTED: uncharacterized protein LOC100634557 [Amphimedon queenslandica]